MSIDPAAGAIRLPGGLFGRPDYFRTDIAAGTVRTAAGTRVCVLSDDFLRGFRNAVAFECGKAADLVFKRCGRRWGEQFAVRFDREVGKHYGTPTGELSAAVVQACLNEAFRAHGWGRLAVEFSAYDHGFIQAELRDPMMPEVVGHSDRPTDALSAGLLAAIFSHYAGLELDCVQTDCPSRGADAGRFVVGLAERLAPVGKWVLAGADHAAVMNRLIAAETGAP